MAGHTATICCETLGWPCCSGNVPTPSEAHTPQDQLAEVVYTYVLRPLPPPGFAPLQQDPVEATDIPRSPPWHIRLGILFCSFLRSNRILSDL